jgi:hypothetical protein
MSSSWTPSYSTTAQGSSPCFKSETVPKDDSEAVSSEPPASDDIPATSQDVEPAPAPVEPMPAEEVPEPAMTEDAKSTDEVLPIGAATEQPPDAFDTSLGETPAVEGEAEVPPVEEVKAAGTPEIVTPADEESVEPSATTEASRTQSYSVTFQPGSPRVSPKAEMKELKPEPHPVEPPQETPVTPPVFEFADVPKTVVTHAIEDEDGHVAEPAPQEESKPAWTQSYSVTSQPGSPRVSPKQVPEEIPEAEEAKPSWTRSYSVTSQPESPRVLPKEDLPEPTVEPVTVADEPTTVVTPPVEDAIPAPAEAEAPERPKSPWAPSYSVTTLEGQTEQVPPEDAVPEPEVVSIPETFVGEAPGPQPEADVPVTDTPTSLTVNDEAPERPKSPWTPSYSAITLSSSAPVEEPEPRPVTGKPSVDVEVPPLEQTEAVKAEEHPKESGAISDVFEVHEAVTQPAVHDEPQVDVKVPELALPQLDLVSFTCRGQMIRSILIAVLSPSRVLPVKRNPLGLLRTQSRTFQARARGQTRGKSFRLLRIFQQRTNPPSRRSNLLPPKIHTHRDSPRRRPRTTGRIISPGCPSPWMRPQRGELLSFRVDRSAAVLTSKP